MIQYRRASIDDVENVLKARIDFLVEANHIQSEHDRELMVLSNRDYIYHSLLDKSLILWLAVDEGHIVATGSASLYKLPPNADRPEGKVAYIGSMFTYPEYRKQGIATKLFALVVEDVKENGYTQMELHATEMGRPIYEKYGFKASQASMIYSAN